MKLDTLKLKELNRACQLNESLLRFMFIKVDERLIDALVAHAQEKVVVPIDAKKLQAVGVGSDVDDEEIEVEEE
jgi:hypothetical protein